MVKSSEQPENNGLLDDLIRQSGLDKSSDFLRSIDATPSGFRYTYPVLEGGCLLWLFFSVIVPFILFGIANDFRRKLPTSADCYFYGGITVGWIALLHDLFHKIVLIAEPGKLTIEHHWLRLRISRNIDLGKTDLEVYKQSASLGGAMVSYGIRPQKAYRGLGVRLHYRDANLLMVLIESIVRGKR